MLVPCFAGSGLVVTLGELMMILELPRQGLTVTAIARQTGLDRKTVRRYITRGLEPPAYGPRTPKPRSTDPFLLYPRERLAAHPGPTAVRLHRELKERGFAGSYTIAQRAGRDIRPEPPQPFEVRFETPRRAGAGRLRPLRGHLPRWTGRDADRPALLPRARSLQADLARFIVHQDLRTVPRCHIAAFEAIGGAPREIPTFG
jgi:transposase